MGEPDTTKEMVTFKIYLTNKNSPRPHIECLGKDFSFFPSEKEILLLPFI